MLTADGPGQFVLISVDTIPLGGGPILSRFVRKGRGARTPDSNQNPKNVPVEVPTLAKNARLGHSPMNSLLMLTSPF